LRADDVLRTPATPRPERYWSVGQVLTVPVRPPLSSAWWPCSARRGPLARAYSRVVADGNRALCEVKPRTDPGDYILSAIRLAADRAAGRPTVEDHVRSAGRATWSTAADGARSPGSALGEAVLLLTSVDESAIRCSTSQPQLLLT
jgi:hypothetical protein